jgi:NitT/TauT family transport system substrate-binding protein
MDAASMFKSGQVDAAIVWSPDDMDCLAAVKGSKILSSTKTSTHIIADVLIAKDKFINDNKDKLIGLYDGWMKGAAELNSSDSAKKKAAKILAENFEGVDENFCYTAINNARLTTHGDNLNFFGLNYTYKGITGEDIWNKMTVEYSKLNYVPKQMNWRSVKCDDIVKGSKLLLINGQEAEKIKEFTTPTTQMADNDKIVAMSTKSAAINFASGDYKLSDEAKFLIDKEFVDIAKINTTARIRIIGNTDNTGSYNLNIELSKKRANAVADYLANEYSINKNRMVIVGNGPKEALKDKVIGSSETYRRTDFELIIE